MSKWECGVCGYIHKEDGPPEKCPVCEAPAKMFTMVGEEEKEAVAPPVATETRWRCTVCGYIHIGKEPPAKCPVCAAPANLFVEIDGHGKTIGEAGGAEAEQCHRAEQCHVTLKHQSTLRESARDSSTRQTTAVTQFSPASYCSTALPSPGVKKTWPRDSR